jgi:DNA polymerase III subunit epsilon
VHQTTNMRILFFDTETNGLPANRYAPPHMVAAWPYILQLAWEVWDFSKGTGAAGAICEQRGNVLVAPRHDMKWDEGAAKIHGISYKNVRDLGVPMNVALRWFMSDAAGADYIVAHNLAFDRAVIQAESHRLGVDPANWWPAGECCSMLETVAYCAIPAKVQKPGGDPYKWPRLAELWTRLWPHTPPPTDLHDAAADVRCLVTCFRELLSRGVVTLRPVTPLPAAKQRTPLSLSAIP